MKNLFLAAIAVFTIGAASAQDMKFGAKAGLNLATLSGQEGAKLKFGYVVGGFAEFKVSDKFAIQPELLYSVQGAKGSSTTLSSVGAYSISSTSEGNRALSYLNIPVMGKYFVTEAFTLEVGPQVGILLSSNTKSDTTITSNFPGIPSSSKSTEDTSKDDLSTVDFSLNFGAGYDVIENLTVGVRYGLGLTKVNKESAAGFTDYKNAVTQITVAFKF